MHISILCTDPNHPVMSYLQNWIKVMEKDGHEIVMFHNKSDLCGGDILFLVSCSQMIRAVDKEKYRSALVLHASDLPKGRGWSPHIWAILDGAKEITVCLLEADNPLDSGAIWLREKIFLEGHELLPEINDKLFNAELLLMSTTVQQFHHIRPVLQTGEPGLYNRKRTPEDSRIDPYKTIAEQFDLFRIVDNERYPAFFDYRGNRYLLKIEKSEK